jgi:hypothetical protein
MKLKTSFWTLTVLLLAVPSAAQIDPQSLVGVWEGSYEVRQQQGAPTPGSITITITKVEDGKVYIKQETMGVRANRPVEYVSNLTPTGYSHTNRTGHPTTTVVEGDKMRMTSTTPTGAPMTANLVKKK